METKNSLWESRNLHTHKFESQNKVKTFPWKSKKDFQIRTFKTRKKDQHKKNELKRRINETNNMIENDTLSLVQKPQMIACMIATCLSHVRH